MANINNTNEEIKTLSLNVNEITGRITILTSVISELSRALPIDELRKMAVTTGNLSRSLVATKLEISNLTAGVESLSKITSYYNKQVLLEMSTQLKSTTSSLAAFYQNNVKLVELFTTTYKRDGPQYLQLFEQLNQKIPVLSTRMASASTSASTMFEIFRTAGPQGISTYLTSIGKMEKETKNAVDNIDDYFNKFFTSFKNTSLELGKSFSQNLTGLISPENAAAIGTAGGGAALLGIAGRYSAGIGNITVPKGKQGNFFGPAADYFQGGMDLNPYLEGYGSRALRAAPGILAGGALAIGGLNANALDNPLQAGLGLGGAGLAGYSVGSIFGKGAAGAAVGVIVESFGQAATAVLYSVSEGLKGAPGKVSPKVIKDAEDIEAEADKIFGTIGPAIDAFTSFGGILPSHHMDAREKFIRDSVAESLRVNTQEELQTDRRAEQLFREKSTREGMTEIGRMAASRSLERISPEEADMRAIELLQTNLANFDVFLGGNSEYGKLKDEEFGRLQVQKQTTQQQIFGLQGRQAEFTGARLAQAGGQFEFLRGTDIGAIAGGQGVGGLRTAIQAQIGQIGGQIEARKGLEGDPQIAKELAAFENQRLQLRKQLLDLASAEAMAQKELVSFGRMFIEQGRQRAELSGADFDMLQSYAIASVAHIEAQIALTEKALTLATSENEKRKLAAQLQEELTQKAKAEFEIRRMAFGMFQNEIQQKQAFRGVFGVTGPEEQIKDISGEIQSRQEQIDQQLVSGVEKDRVQREIEILEVKKQYIEATEVSLRQQERQNELINGQLQIATVLKVPMTVLAQLRGAALEGARNELAILEQNRETTVNTIQKLQASDKLDTDEREKLFQIDKKILGARSAIAQQFDVQRRTLAEQFTEQVVNAPSGSYLNPNMLSQFATQGPGYFQGISQAGSMKGTYSSQLQTMFGEGITEKSTFEQFADKLLGGTWHIVLDQDGRGDMHNVPAAAANAP